MSIYLLVYIVCFVITMASRWLKPVIDFGPVKSVDFIIFDEIEESNLVEFIFAAYLLKELQDKVEGFSYVPMLFCNQSALEGQFSAIQSSGYGSTETYEGQITNKSVRKVNLAQPRSHMCSTEDCVKENET